MGVAWPAHGPSGYQSSLADKAKRPFSADSLTDAGVPTRNEQSLQEKKSLAVLRLMQG